MPVVMVTTFSNRMVRVYNFCVNVSTEFFNIFGLINRRVQRFWKHNEALGF